jgi:hypothetical protein
MARDFDSITRISGVSGTFVTRSRAGFADDPITYLSVTPRDGTSSTNTVSSSEIVTRPRSTTLG